MKILTPKEARTRAGDLSRTTAWALEKSGDFPKAVVLTGRRKGYIEDEIDAWIQARIDKRDEEVA